MGKLAAGTGIGVPVTLSYVNKRGQPLRTGKKELLSWIDANWPATDGAAAHIQRILDRDQEFDESEKKEVKDQGFPYHLDYDAGDFQYPDQDPIDDANDNVPNENERDENVDDLDQVPERKQQSEIPEQPGQAGGDKGDHNDEQDPDPNANKDDNIDAK